MRLSKEERLQRRLRSGEMLWRPLLLLRSSHGLSPLVRDDSNPLCDACGAICLNVCAVGCAVTLVDSTGALPQRVVLRTSPCELSIVNVEDRDICYASVPYNDLLKWDLQVGVCCALNAGATALMMHVVQRCRQAAK